MKYKILIIGPAWVGDMVMSQTLLKILVDKYQGQVIIDVIANSWASGFLSRMPEINQVIISTFKHGKLDLLSRIKLGLELKKNNYDQAFILPNSFKSAIVPFFAGIKLRTGFIGEMRYGLINNCYKLDKSKLPLMVDRFCALANNGQKPRHIPKPLLNVNTANQNQLIYKFNLNPNQAIVGFCPAAEYGPAKRWPTEYFAELADKLHEHNYQILILGSNKDILIAEEILAKIKTVTTKVTNVCGKTSLSDAVDLLNLTKYVVTNDSGLMHIASAVNTQVIVVYGSSSPQFTPPLTNKAKIIQIKLECSPCFERTCKFGHYNCLKLITPNMVLKSIQS
mgnify:CR=1 FL=1